MDGVLTDSEPAFFAAVNDVLARYGKRITVDEYRPCIGTLTDEMWSRVRALKDVPATVDELVEIYEEPLMRRLHEPRPPLPGAHELIATLQGRGVPLGMCTASYQRWVDVILPSAGIDHAFDAVVTAGMVGSTKPDPAPYVLAASLLGVPAAACVVVEDSTAGLTSALRAGAYVVQLRATDTAAPPMEGVGMVIESLRDFPLALVCEC